jgi:extracellular factor (EF) 3-hydroxypalmitic acid methyl ester biosynthesis protein
MSEEAAVSAGKDKNMSAFAPMGRIPQGPTQYLKIVDRPAVDWGAAERPGISKRAAMPISAAFLRTKEWRLTRGVIQTLKTSFFTLSRQLEQDSSPRALRYARERMHLVLDELNGGLQSTADMLMKSDAAAFLRGYLFREVFPYFSLSRFAKRAYHKPGGYAGDYLMMEMIYNNEPRGNGTMGRLIDGWCLNTGAARAVRGRRKFLKDLLSGLCERRRDSGATTRILNLACGTNRELFDFLAQCGYSDLIAVTGIDGDPRAIEYSKRYVDVFAHNASVRLLTDNVVRWAVRRNTRSVDTYDIIYTSGLTDYLGDKVFTALVGRAFERLSNGGTFVVGNFGHRNPNKVLMDDVLEWRLIHRSEADLLRLFEGTGFGSNVRIASEEGGVNLFAIATKSLS